MSKHLLSRRTLLASAIGLFPAAFLGQRGLAAPTTASLDSSPANPGPYQTGRLILGEDDGFTEHAIPQFFEYNKTPGFPGNYATPPVYCVDGTLVSPRLPRKILAAVYYPSNDAEAGKDMPASLAQGSFPVMLYAHSYRDPQGSACKGSHPSTRDFVGVETMLGHVASYGCVVISPDLSWLPGGFPAGDPNQYPYSIRTRADILIAYYQHLLENLNTKLFEDRLDLSRLVLAGHSTGGPSAAEAGRILTTDPQFASLSFQSVSYGLIAPLLTYSTGIAKRNLLVLRGTLDTLQVADPKPYYIASEQPKTLVTIEGANHFGYTDLCPPDNSASGLYDNNGTIPRDAQQLVGASYLAALVRYYALSDESARPYLSGETPITALQDAGASDIEVNSKGLHLAAP